MFTFVNVLLIDEIAHLSESNRLLVGACYGSFDEISR